MNSWILTGANAEWTNKSVALSFAYSNPGQGISLQHPATKTTWSLFGITPSRSESLVGRVPGSLTSSGATLRALYPASDAFPVETQVAWSVVETDRSIVGLDMTVSVGTEKLEAFPLLHLCSHIGDSSKPKAFHGQNDRAQAGESCVLLGLRSTPLSYVEMVLPSGFDSTHVGEDAEVDCSTIRHQLFACSLEKGVVLRTRLRGLLLAQSAEAADTEARYRDFIAAPPPLSR